MFRNVKNDFWRHVVKFGTLRKKSDFGLFTTLFGVVASSEMPNMRFGNIPPFQTMADHSSMPSSNLRDSFVYGFYETALCSVPNGINPAKDYYVGVSNDAGVSASPQHKAMTYSEYSMKTSATASRRSRFEPENLISTPSSSIATPRRVSTR